MSEPPGLEYRTSPLLRLAYEDSRFDVWRFFDEKSYPGEEPVKEEIERHVADLITSYEPAAIDEGLRHHHLYLVQWVPERLAGAEGGSERARLVAFADLQYMVDDRRFGLMRESLGHPSAQDPVFEALPSIYGELTRDGLYRLGPANLPQALTGAETVIAVGEDALYPHPILAHKRELSGLLMDLAAGGDLRVYVALDPFRRDRLDDVRPRLLEDYWFGIRTTRANLDSMDAHDVDSVSFHAAGERSRAQELFHPLLGTWFDWTKRGDDSDDPVKRLYVREVRPPHDGRGDQLLAVHNNELHAERDTRRRCFTHVDGKVRRYPVEAYGPSRENPTAGSGAPSHSRKLWRVDGPLTDEQWCQLVGLHFRGNELIGEHFASAFPAMQVVDRP